MLDKAQQNPMMARSRDSLLALQACAAMACSWPRGSNASLPSGSRYCVCRECCGLRSRRASALAIRSELDVIRQSARATVRSIPGSRLPRAVAGPRCRRPRAHRTGPAGGRHRLLAQLAIVDEASRSSPRFRQTLRACSAPTVPARDAEDMSSRRCSDAATSCGIANHVDEYRARQQGQQFADQQAQAGLLDEPGAMRFQRFEHASEFATERIDGRWRAPCAEAISSRRRRPAAGARRPCAVHRARNGRADCLARAAAVRRRRARPPSA